MIARVLLSLLLAAAAHAQPLPERIEPAVPDAASRRVQLPPSFYDAPPLAFLYHGKDVDQLGGQVSHDLDVVALEVLGGDHPRRGRGSQGAINHWLRPEAARRLGLPVVTFRLDGRRVSADVLQRHRLECLRVAGVVPARTWWGGRRSRPGEVRLTARGCARL